MTVYGKKFENVYEKNLISDIDGVETVEVTGKTTYNYTNGLTIDATGQTFYRKANQVSTKTPKHSLDYQTSETYGIAQLGYATINYQANVTNLAVAIWKTETSTSYNLAGGLFVNPSPIKMFRSGARKRDHPRIYEFHLVLREKKVEERKKINALCTKLYKLHMWGF
ncbi:hypothetical protein W822_02155 [Advenella kashmirensis W13003]|uniref:Uncharacterized protein n=1 Tax=Advenella kashmirensis W13003 TaxID=1424334 RepID=V8QZD3_9BURK|nr:hypothetical protein [Advenella kashmirensis]ETF04675.1 hypothetical protein W822_02155 [Advenella kashmirensis W13003]